MCRISEIAHYGFHFGFQAEFEAGPEAPEYPDADQWEMIQNHFGILSVDEKFAFAQAYREGIEKDECAKCGDGVLGHKHFMSVIFR
jgi:hypothetical protein